MCRICSKFRNGKISVSKALEEVGDAMKRSNKNNEHLQDLIDRILGIDKEDSEDQEIESDR